MTGPAKPFAATMLIVAVLLLPSVRVTADGAGESVKLGGGVTVSAMVVEAVSAPDVPVMVTVTGPPTPADALAESVRALEPVAPLLAKEAVTPLGRPVAASVTLPVNPFAAMIAIESVALPA